MSSCRTKLSYLSHLSVIGKSITCTTSMFSKTYQQRKFFLVTENQEKFFLCYFTIFLHKTWISNDLKVAQFLINNVNPPELTSFDQQNFYLSTKLSTACVNYLKNSLESFLNIFLKFIKFNCCAPLRVCNSLIYDGSIINIQPISKIYIGA